MVTKRIPLMSVKGFATVSGIVVLVALSTSGNSLVPDYPQMHSTLNLTGAAIPSLPTSTPDGTLTFHSTLVEAPRKSAVVLAIWTRSGSDESRSGELSGGADALTSLPEPGSGLLLGLGFLMSIPLISKRRTSSDKL
jgi:hypothetical protein